MEPQLEGDRDIVRRQRARARRDRVGLQLLIEFYQFGIGGGLALAVQPLQQMAAPFGEVDGARRQRLGMKGEPQDVEGLAEQPRRDALQQRHHHAVGRHQVPVPVIGQRRIGLMRLQHQIDRRPRRFQRGIVERTLRKRRRISRRHQQHVAFAQGNLQPFGQLQHHLARRRRAAGFHKTQMPRRDLGVAGEIQLAEMAALPPFAQVIADMDGLGSLGSRRGGVCVHGENLPCENRALPLPPT